MPDIYYSDNRNHEPRLYWASIVGLPKWIYAKSRNSPFAHDRTRDRKIPEIVKDKPVYGAGRGGGLPVHIDSKQVIENTRRSKLSKRRKRGSEVHDTYTRFQTNGFRLRSH